MPQPPNASRFRRADFKPGNLVTAPSVKPAGPRSRPDFGLSIPVGEPKSQALRPKAELQMRRSRNEFLLRPLGPRKPRQADGVRKKCWWYAISVWWEACCSHFCSLQMPISLTVPKEGCRLLSRLRPMCRRCGYIRTGNGRSGSISIPSHRSPPLLSPRPLRRSRPMRRPKPRLRWLWKSGRLRLPRSSARRQRRGRLSPGWNRQALSPALGRSVEARRGPRQSNAAGWPSLARPRPSWSRSSPATASFSTIPGEPFLGRRAQTLTTILPICWLDSRYRCASTIWSSVKTLSITGLRAPDFRPSVTNLTARSNRSGWDLTCRME